MCFSSEKSLDVNIHSFDESDIFLSKLEGVNDPEEKEKLLEISLLNLSKKYLKNLEIYLFSSRYFIS